MGNQIVKKFQFAMQMNQEEMQQYEQYAMQQQQ